MKALEARSLPYAVIDLNRFPDRLGDLKSLARGAASVPQVFFNTRFVGGVNETLKELKEWDDLKNSQYKSAVERYEVQIACFPDPSNPMLALSPSNPADEDQSSMVSQLVSNDVQLCLDQGWST